MAWWLLAVLAASTVALPFLDAAGIIREGIPTDHAAAFRALTGAAFATSLSAARYVRQLELAYAVHELTFGLLFLVIVAVPLRRGDRWAWWACWIPLIAYVGYAVFFARFAPNTLAYSLVPVVALPLLLMLQWARFRRSPG